MGVVDKYLCNKKSELGNTHYLIGNQLSIITTIILFILYFKCFKCKHC